MTSILLNPTFRATWIAGFVTKAFPPAYLHAIIKESPSFWSSRINDWIIREQPLNSNRSKRTWEPWVSKRRWRRWISAAVMLSLSPFQTLMGSWMCRNVSSVIEHTFTLHQVSDTVDTRRAELSHFTIIIHRVSPLNSLARGRHRFNPKTNNSNPNVIPCIKNVICYITGSHVHESKYSFSRIGAYPLSLACFLPLTMFAVVHPTHPRTPSPHKFKCIYSQAQPGPSAAWIISLFSRFCHVSSLARLWPTTYIRTRTPQDKDRKLHIWEKVKGDLLLWHLLLESAAPKRLTWLAPGVFRYEFLFSWTSLKSLYQSCSATWPRTLIPIQTDIWNCLSNDQNSSMISQS